MAETQVVEKPFDAAQYLQQRNESEAAAKAGKQVEPEKPKEAATVA